MQIAALSLTWRDAPSSVRAVAALPIDEADWQALMGQGARGLCEVHTCARSMWILAAPDAAWVAALLQARLQVRLVETGMSAPPPALWLDDEALRHVFRVTLGLDSVVEGESDIGAQICAAFAASADSGRLCPALTGLWRAVVDLTNEARHQGVLRPGRGMGHLAAEALVRAGVHAGDRVAVVGLGSIGRQVVASVARAGLGEAACFNRSERPGARPLAELRFAEAVVVCTAAPSAWYVAPAGVRVVVDLGRPAQVRGAAVSLDDLLAGAGLALDDRTRLMARSLAEAAISAHADRVRAHAASPLLAQMQRLRDEHAGARLDDALAAALAGVDPAVRRRVISSTRKVVRRYGHEVLGLLRGVAPEPGGGAEGAPLLREA